MSVLEQLRARRDEILALASKHRITSIQVVGSVSRGQERADSDIDLLVTTDPACSLIDMIGFMQDLEEMFGRPVDALTATGLHELIRNKVIRQAVPL